MESRERFTERLRGYSPPAWEELPDLGLYMDQIITYLERQCRALHGDKQRIITPAMINNYVKCGLVIRPKGKKYNREQLAQLMMLCMLKQAVSLEDLGLLMQARDPDSLEALYRTFCATQSKAVQDLVKMLPQLSPLACAVQASSYQLLCEEFLREKEDAGNPIET